MTRPRRTATHSLHFHHDANVRVVPRLLDRRCSPLDSMLAPTKALETNNTRRMPARSRASQPRHGDLLGLLGGIHRSLPSTIPILPCLPATDGASPQTTRRMSHGCWSLFLRLRNHSNIQLKSHTCDHPPYPRLYLLRLAAVFLGQCRALDDTHCIGHTSTLATSAALGSAGQQLVRGWQRDGEFFKAEGLVLVAGQSEPQQGTKQRCTGCRWLRSRRFSRRAQKPAASVSPPAGRGAWRGAPRGD